MRITASPEGTKAARMVLALLLIGVVHEPTRYAAFVAIALYVVTAAWPRRRRPARVSRVRRTAQHKVDEAVDRHIDVLARKRSVLVRPDDYGLVDDAEWRKELDYFARKVVAPSLTEDEAAALAVAASAAGEGWITEAQDARITERAERLLAASGDVDQLSPAQFEAWCAAELRRRGWVARATKASGDQGGDVLAERNGVRLVVQCKRAAAPVGNKAVQEAYAAQRHYRADLAAVIATSGFTKAARELAHSTGVALHRAADIETLDRLAGATAQPRAVAAGSPARSGRASRKPERPPGLP